MIPKADIDYIEIYAKRLKENNFLFKQQKRLIESQLYSSSQIFKKMFGTGKNFKNNARKYIKSIGMI